MRKSRKVWAIFLLFIMSISLCSSIAYGKELNPTTERYTDGDIIVEEDNSEDVEEELISEEPEKDYEERETASEEPEISSEEDISSSDEQIVSDVVESEDVLGTGNVIWTESRTLTENTTIDGDLTISATTNLGGYVLTVKGNLIIDAWVDTGSFGRIDVKGNLICKSGYLILCDGAVADVSGDLRFCGLDANGNEVKGTCRLYWTESSAVINIGGDYIINTTGDVDENLTINLKGNLINKSGNSLSGTTINFNGSNQQLIDITKDVELGNIGGTNDNIKIKKYFNGKLKKNFTLKTDEEKVYIFGTLNMNGYSLTIPSSVVVDAWLDSGNFGRLTVGGNLIVKSGYFILQDGAVADIAGDLRFCGLDANENEVKGSGCLYWIESSAVINIGGAYYINTTGDVNYNITINLKGDLIDKSDSSLSNTNINFNGTKQQIIDISENVSLGNIGGTNDNIKVGKYFNGKIQRDYTFKTDEDTIYIKGTLSLNGHSLTIPATVVADVWLESGNLGKFIVGGNLIFRTGYFILQDGAVADIAGDLRFCGLDANENEVKGSGRLYWIESSAVINIGSAYYINTTGDVNYGLTINLKGDLINKSGNSLSYCIINLLKDASADNKQVVNMEAGGKIGTLSLGSCGDFYEITEGCYNKLEKPEHKYDKGIVTKETTKTEEGEKTFTCTVCGHAYIEKIPRVEEEFKDVSQTAWYVDAVQFAYENDIMVGKGFFFKPNASITREEFTQVLYSLEDKPAISIENTYSDVKQSWYTNSVLWAKEKHIASGKPDGSFGVGSPITRQDLAVMLYKYAKFKSFDLTTDDTAINGFKDTSAVQGYAKEAMNWAVSQGVLSGKGKGINKSDLRLDPAGKATRAECAAMIMNLIVKNTQ